MSHHHSIFEDQARELYVLCDEEKKGYITRDDMFRLKSYLPLNDDQLISVFESLDADNNGSLTFDEFIVGFGKFLGTSFDTSTYDSDNQPETNDLDDAVKEHLDHLLNRVSKAGLNEDLESIKETWFRLQSKNPELLTNFESLIENIINDMQETNNEYQSLENMLKNKSITYDDEMKHLYDEMENQLKQEKEKMLKEERTKELQLKSQIEAEIKAKDNMLREIQKENDKVKNELSIVINTHTESNQERERLEKEKHTLEYKLNNTDKALRDCQEYINELNKKSKQNKRNRAKAAIEMTEGIALERETLVRQLDELKEINKQLQEEKLKKLQKKFISNNDNTMDLSKELSLSERKSPEPKVIDIHEAYSNKKRGSILSSYFTPLINTENISEDKCDNIIYDDNEDQVESSLYEYTNNHAEFLEETIQTHTSSPLSLSVSVTEVDRNCQEIEIQTDDLNEEDLGERLPPDGAGEEIIDNITSIPEKPERIFKIVFVGDSSVGKTSILKRFCDDEFKEDGLASTIGVDFQIRSMRVDGYFVALQLWDTAGQERFRSITSQYYRKADGVVLVYDVLNEASLINLREWMYNVKSEVEEGTAIMVLANKCDTFSDNDTKDKELQKLKGFIETDDIIIFCCSAKSGENVSEAFQSLSKILTKKENNDLKTALTIDSNTKKGCCG